MYLLHVVGYSRQLLLRMRPGQDADDQGHRGVPTHVQIPRAVSHHHDFFWRQVAVAGKTVHHSRLRLHSETTVRTADKIKRLTNSHLAQRAVGVALVVHGGHAQGDTPLPEP